MRPLNEGEFNDDMHQIHKILDSHSKPRIFAVGIFAGFVTGVLTTVFFVLISS